MEFKNTTRKFEIVASINQESFCKNIKDVNENDIANLWSRISKDISKELKKDIYFPINIYKSIIAYDIIHGNNGIELSFNIIGIANQKYIKYIKEWDEISILYCKKLKEYIKAKNGQITIEFLLTNIEYI